MKHLTDREIMAQPSNSHLSTCSLCSMRRQELENALAEFTGSQRERELPSAGPARVTLMARLSAVPDSTGPAPHYGWLAAAALALLCVAIYAAMPFRFLSRETAAIPNPRLTPGSTILVSREEICRASRESNRTVPVSLRKRVFDSYGIPNAEPRAYEVDYLITPALGGADDINNLWPQPYGSTRWNARVKDALEDHLRNLVCEGKVDLPTAQREIATNWIAAYKKYFKTNRPRNLDN
jgi:hypothetical protein